MTDGPDPVFFLDRNLGRKTVPTLLRDAGLVVEVMDDHFAPDTPDEVWLEEVGNRGWFVVTLDEKIRYRRGEQDAVRRFDVGLFLLVRWKGSTGLGYAAALLKAKKALLRLTVRQERPFIAKVYGDGRVSLWLKRGAGGTLRR
ncbi:MAG: hypothetical protein B7Z61_08165 [Acidobacteria bacterium 37-71-11]|nr:MAG: hypothetical protein B7Z61_08165 [Acidobacteria bacterium 37-71-11]HQT95107.1 hypothetical protein [Thermoanaerobaculaceae bacterium]